MAWSKSNTVLNSIVTSYIRDDLNVVILLLCLKSKQLLNCSMSLFQLQDHQECATRMNSSVSQMAAVFLITGNVMAILTVQMAQMNIIDVLPERVLRRFSAVTTATACIERGSVMVITTAGIWVTREIVQLSPSGAPAGSGSAQVTASVWISAKYAIIMLIVLMELMNPPCAVSYCSSIYYGLWVMSSEWNGIFSMLYFMSQCF